MYIYIYIYTHTRNYTNVYNFISVYPSSFKLGIESTYVIDKQKRLFDTLKKVLYKHLGLEDLVSTVIERMGNVKKIILIEE